MRRSWRQPQHTVGKLLIVGLALFGCLSGAGCSKKDNPAANTPPKIDICGLVTQAEMETVLGTKLKAPELQNKILCQYVSVDGEKDLKTASLLVRYILETDDPAKAYQQYEADVKKQAPNFAMQPVEGLGVQAGWEAEFRQLALFKGRFMVIVSAHLPKGENALDAAKKIAEKALPRLP